MKTLLLALMLASLIAMPIACEGGLDSYGDFNCTGNAQFNGNVKVKNGDNAEYNLPTADGTAGQVMKTDGAGNMSFADETLPTLDQVLGTNNISTFGAQVSGLTLRAEGGESGDASLQFSTGDYTRYFYLAGGNGVIYSNADMVIGKYFKLYNETTTNCELNFASGSGAGSLFWNDFNQWFAFDKPLQTPSLRVFDNNSETVTITMPHQAGVGYIDAINDGFTFRNDGGQLMRIQGSGSLTIKDVYTLPNVDGTEYQVLKTDGAGNVSWMDDNGGDSEEVDTLDSVVQRGYQTTAIVEVGGVQVKNETYTGFSGVPAYVSFQSGTGSWSGQIKQEENGLIYATEGIHNFYEDVMIGRGEADVDYALTFNGEDNDGLITWMEDEDMFTMACDLAVSNSLVIGDNAKVSGDLAAGGNSEASASLYVQSGIITQGVPLSVWVSSVDVDLPNGISLQQTDQGTRTFEVFVRTPPQNPSYENVLYEFVKIGARPTGTNDNWALVAIEDGSVEYRGVVGGGSVVIPSSVPNNVLDGQWHHIVLKIESYEIGIYVDGQQVAYAYTEAQTAPEDNSVELAGTGWGYALAISHLRMENDNPYGLIPNSGCTDSFVVPTTPPAVTGNTQFYLALTDDLVSEGIEDGITFRDRTENTSTFANNGFFDTGSLLIGMSLPHISLNGDTDVDGTLAIRGSLLDQNDKYLALDSKTISISISKPLDLAEADNLPIWTNRTGKPFIIDKIYATSDTDDVDFQLVETNDYTDLTDITTIQGVQIADDGTDVFYKEILAVDIDHTDIEDGHGIVFDNDGTDDPDYIDITIVGYFKDL